MKTLTVICYSMLLCGSAAMAELNGSDNFNDNVMDPAKWTVEAPLLTETNSRLEFTSTGVGEEEGIWAWTPNSGSYTQDWSITMDVHNGSIPSSVDEIGSVGIAVVKDFENSFWVALMTAGSGGFTDTMIDTGWNTDDVDTISNQSIATNSISLSISYDSATRILRSSYNMGSGFLVATNFNVDNWSMGEGDVLDVYISSYSESLAVSSGQIFMDNFVAIPEPGTLSFMLVVGAAGTLLTRYKKARMYQHWK